MYFTRKADKDIASTKVKVLPAQRVGLSPSDEIANFQRVAMTVFKELISGYRVVVAAKHLNRINPKAPRPEFNPLACP
jgi:hypothetical protein